jgi:hypothetical protein
MEPEQSQHIEQTPEKKPIKIPWTLKQYSVFTMTHLFFIDVGLAILCKLYPDWKDPLYFGNMAYLMLVGIHGIYWGAGKLMPFFKMAYELKPYWDAVQKRNVKGKLTPEKFGELLDSGLRAIENHAKEPGPETTITGEKSLAELQNELSG